MSVLVFVEGVDGEIKKSSFEAISYAAELAKKKNTHAVAVVIGAYPADALESLGKYGASKVLNINNDKLKQPVIQPYATAIAEAANKETADVIILSKSSIGEAVASRLAVKLKAAVVSNVIELPDLSGGFKVKKSLYTGKAFANIELKADKKVLTIAKNACSVTETGGKATVESFAPSIPDTDFSTAIKEVSKATGDILLTEADIVVSGGRGLKGPENWHLVTDLAKALGAATGCSKPVSDLDWRPHHEHVGQTGIKVSPNLYIAIGISGAIQHLAGVNSSKCIVVINKDPEAPFFKAADYGIAGDAFEVVPKLIAAAKNYK
ncbi:MAG: electron transfer flavoprotein subunit alpha/FixB family protein [Cytophagaceae bacterium]|nr:electron transfer flavoprotein subunit alpha/FixB family protein [Cytophagaceae bacterium]